jgi:hypothetical protein
MIRLVFYIILVIIFVIVIIFEIVDLICSHRKRRKNAIMKTQIMRHLRKNGYDPKTPQADSNIIGFTYGQDTLNVVLYNQNNFVCICLSFEIGDKINKMRCLDSINKANGDTIFAKAVFYETHIRYNAEFLCDSVKSFKRHFDHALGSIYAIHTMAEEHLNEYDKHMDEIERTQTSYDKIHRYTAYVTIPRVIKMWQEYNVQDRLDDIKTLQTTRLLGIVPRREIWQFPWDEFKITQETLESGRSLIIYEFPAPRRSPQAKFGAVLMDSENKPIDYITLERSYDHKDNDIELNTPELNANIFWVLGLAEWKGSPQYAHLNYGQMEGEPSLENFIQAVKEIFNTPCDQRKYYTLDGM